jgi:hypothetical protein
LISILPRQPRRVGTPHRVDPVHQLQTDLLKLDAVTEDRKRIRCEHADQLEFSCDSQRRNNFGCFPNEVVEVNILSTQKVLFSAGYAASG